MTHVQNLFFRYGQKTDNAFYAMMKDEEIQSIIYDTDVEYPHLRLLCPKRKNCEKENEYIVNACQKDANGLVLNIVTGEIVTFVDRLGWYGTWDLESDIDLNRKLYVMEQGTVIRMGYDSTSTHWIMSTNRKLNAVHAFFASQDSFYDKIEAFLGESFQDWAARELDRNVMYLFIFNDEDGEMPVTRTELVLAGAREKSTFKTINLAEVSLPGKCRKSSRLERKEDVQKEMQTGRGIIAEDESGSRVKYESIHYKKSYSLLQGAPVLSFFLQSYFENRKDIVKHLYKLFPNKQFAMSILQEWGRMYARYIWTWYCHLKIRKGNGRLSPMSVTLSMIQQLHLIHMQQKTPITLPVVENWLALAFVDKAHIYLGHILHLVEEQSLIKKDLLC